MDTASNEPSMDDILASIQRIITDDAASGLGSARRKPMPVPAADPVRDATDGSDDEEDVLELTSPVVDSPSSLSGWPMDPAPSSPVAAPAAPPMAAPAEAAPPPEAVPPPAPTYRAPPISPAPVDAPAAKPRLMVTAPQFEAVRRDALVSDTAARASREALDSLSTLLVSPAAPPAAAPRTLEDLAADLLKPLLKTWLDEKLPAMVEELVAQEIARITGRRG